MRLKGPWCPSSPSNVQAHNDFVESIAVRNGSLYTAGEKKCKLWDPVTGTQHHQACLPWSICPLVLAVRAQTLPSESYSSS